jgi:hypothetical protein
VAIIIATMVDAVCTMKVVIITTTTLSVVEAGATTIKLRAIIVVDAGLN